MSNQSQIEALLFVAGDEGISFSAISNITGFTHSAIQGIIDHLNAKYSQDNNCALELHQDEDRLYLVTKPELGGILKKYFELPANNKLSKSSLEVLVIIAYKQPITRIEIENIRGVKSTSILQKLLTKEMIQVVGRKDEIGRPIMYGTTSGFLDYFGLKSLDELPPLVDFDAIEVKSGDAPQQMLFDQESTFTKPKNEELNHV